MCSRSVLRELGLMSESRKVTERANLQHYQGSLRNATTVDSGPEAEGQQMNMDRSMFI